MNYTPAPWRVDLDFKHTAIEYHQITALDGPRSDGPGFSITGCINIADAQLIASAPDLLEALRAIIRHGIEEGDGYESVLKQAHDAINKALGR